MSTTPMTPSQWLTALRAEGVDVREYRSWKTHERDDETGKVFGPVNGVVIHHTAGRDSLSLCYNGTSALPGPLCHTHLSKTGVANMLSAGRSNHAGTFAQNAHNAVLAESSVHPRPDEREPVDGNDHYYGLEIENLGNGTDPYPWVQYVQAVKWATAICRHHNWNENSVIGHKEGTLRKIDPRGPVIGPDGRKFDFTMNRFRTDVRAALALPAGVWATEEEDMALTDEDVQKVADAVWGKLFESPVDPGGDKRQASAFLRWADVRHVQNKERFEGLAALVSAVQAKVDAISVGGVDLDALAAKVADVLSQRLNG